MNRRGGDGRTKRNRHDARSGGGWRRRSRDLKKKSRGEDGNCTGGDGRARRREPVGPGDVFSAVAMNYCDRCASERGGPRGKVHRGRNEIKNKNPKQNDSRTLDLQFRTIDSTGTDQLLTEERKKKLIHPAECCASVYSVYGRHSD